jgi:mannose-6-phosphate isomerase
MMADNVTFQRYPLTFVPRVLTKVWGGRKLAELFRKPSTEGPTGEAWEVSAVPGNESVVETGPLVGQRLDRLVRAHGAALVGTSVARRHGDEFPLLLKLIDASDDLSVQVHPDGDQARRLGGGARGKSEAWVVLHADPGARIVHGLEPGVGRDELARHVAAGTIESCLRFVEVGPGDVVPVPPGTLHAICRGVVLLELQESSDTTYRFYDYNRLGLDGKPRPLHVSPALSVVSLDPRPSTVSPARIDGPGRRERLYACDAFEMQRWGFEQPVALGPDDARFWLLTSISGAISIASDSPMPEVVLLKGRSALIPAGLAVSLVPRGGPATVVLGTVPSGS